MEVAPARDSDFSFSSYGDTCYTSAPSSPTRLTELYCEFDQLMIAADTIRDNSLPTIPFAWEEKPGVPKTPTTLLEDDFSFNVSCHLDTESVQSDYSYNAIRTINPDCAVNPIGKRMERERGRDRGLSTSSRTSRLPSSRSRRTRSLSPLGISDQRRTQMVPSSAPTPTPDNNTLRKWSFLDLFLFRSASDGRAMDNDPLKKYSTNFRKHDQDVRNSGSLSKRRGRISAHELHYNVNRAVSNDMKRKTYLPYKQGILGRFSFNP